MRKHYEDEIVGYCDDCASAIYAGEEYIEVHGQLICKDCVYGYTFEEWMDLMKLRWTTSHIPHNEFLREAMEDDKRFCDR